MNPIYFMSRAINVLDIIDHTTKPLTTEAYLDALGDDGMMLEAVTLEEVEATYLYGLDTDERMMLEAITTTKTRIDKTMAAFVRSLNQQLNSSGMEANQAEIGKPAKSGQVAVMTARIPLSDGQSISVVFHSPSGDPGKIVANDDLVAFRFLLNKRDVTHVVAPSGGQDISLKQTCLTLSNLAERNSAKFQSKQAETKAKEAELATLQASTEQLQAEAADVIEKADQLTERAAEDSQKEAEIKAKLDKQVARNEELRRQLAGMGGDPAPSQTAKNDPEPEQGGAPEGGAEPSPEPAVPAEPEKAPMPTDTIRKVNQELNMDGESTLSNGAKISKVFRDEDGSLEGYITLTEPGGKPYVLKSPSSQGGPMEDTAKKLYKAYREGKAEKYLGNVPQLTDQQQPIAEEVSQKLAALPQDPAGWIDGANEICLWLGEQVENGRVDMAEYTAITREIGETINLKSASLPPEMTQLKADKTSKNGAAIVNLNTVYGDSVWVSKDDLESDKKMLPLFNSRGDKLIELKSREGRTDNVVARGNLVIPTQIQPDPEVIEPTAPPADPAFVWNEQARASKFSELSALTNAMLQDGNGSVEIWQQVMTPNSPQVEKNPFYVDGKYETTEVTKAFQEAGYSGTVRQMFNQFADQQWAAIEQANKSPDKQKGKPGTGRVMSSKQNDVVSGIEKHLKLDLMGDAFRVKNNIIGLEIDSLEDHQVRSIESYGEQFGIFSVVPGGYKKINLILTTQSGSQESPPNVRLDESSNQWGESDPDVLALLQQAEVLRTTETCTDRYLSELQRIGEALEKAGAVERHEPYLHTVSDHLTELMEAEGV